jgi:hypothetical protein
MEAPAEIGPRPDEETQTFEGHSTLIVQLLYHQECSKGEGHVSCSCGSLCRSRTFSQGMAAQGTGNDPPGSQIALHLLRVGNMDPPVHTGDRVPVLLHGQEAELPEACRWSCLQYSVAGGTGPELARCACGRWSEEHRGIQEQVPVRVHGTWVPNEDDLDPVPPEGRSTGPSSTCPP